jgi:hypothetical protein
LLYAIISAEQLTPLDSGARLIPSSADTEALVLASSFVSERRLRRENVLDKDQDLEASMPVQTRAGEWILAPILVPATLAGMPLVCKPSRRTRASKERCSARLRIRQGREQGRCQLEPRQGSERFRLVGSTLENAFLTISTPIPPHFPPSFPHHLTSPMRHCV